MESLIKPVLFVISTLMASHAVAQVDPTDIETNCEKVMTERANQLPLSAEKRENYGMSMINVCLVGYQVAMEGDLKTHEENLMAFSTNIQKPAPDSDWIALVAMKDAYMTGFEWGEAG
ncbi:TPA: hypothetical protein LU109_003591 [Enterobacter hormaechei subsp. xiangfangensis]|nr:hypothetical protein [Enterobacter hormaechei subsp. xiangfangensis]